MKTILTHKPGDASQLYLGDVPTPTPKSGELLVEVKATSVNRADILQREGKYPPPAGESAVLGLDVAGIVADASQGSGRFVTGDRVMALVGGGGYAEYALVPEELAMPIPANLNFTAAAAIPEAFLTAYQALFFIADLQAGQSVLIHAGASGVGTAAIQLAKAASAAQIFVTVGSDDKMIFCESLGVDKAINYKKNNFSDVILEETQGRGVAVLVDFIGAPYWQHNIASLALDGKMVLLATMGGANVPDCNLRDIMRKRLQINGSTLRARSLAYKIKLTKAFELFAHDRFFDESLRPIVDTVFPLAEVAEAHRYVEANLNRGKVVLAI